MGRFFILQLLSVFLTFSLQIKERISVKTYVEPSIYVFPVKVLVKAKTEGDILNALSAVDNGVKALGLPYEGGQYEIFPLEVCPKGEKPCKVVGFKGVILYRFLMKNPSDSSRVVYLLENIKRNYGITYLLGKPYWTIPEEVREKILSRLRKKLLKRIKDLAGFYSRTFHKECKVEGINFESSFYYPTPYRISSPPIPKKGKKEISLSAEVVFECR